MLASDGELFATIDLWVSIGTFVLQTVWVTDSGSVRVTDFLPLTSRTDVVRRVEGPRREHQLAAAAERARTIELDDLSGARVGDREGDHVLEHRRLEHLVAPLARGLRAVHRDVGVAQHLVGGLAGLRDGDADAGVQKELLLHGVHRPLIVTAPRAVRDRAALSLSGGVTAARRPGGCRSRRPGCRR